MRRSPLLISRLLMRRIVYSGTVPSNNRLWFIVFSKDRPLQLDALLRSVQQFVSGRFRLSILWQASDDEMAKAYQEVLHRSISIIDESRRETHFRSDLNSLLASKTESSVSFLVDDLLFIQPFDCNSLANINLWKCIPSLRLGRGITYCQPTQLASPPPVLNAKALSPWLSFRWTDSVGDWSMPTSLDGHVFLTAEMRLLSRALQYKAPNSLEKVIGGYRFWFKFRSGLCFERPVIRNFAFNRVQTENEDFPCGETDSQMLLSKWNDGWQFDLSLLFEASANSCHVVVEPAFERHA